jgi:hypothetical protein
VKKTVSKFGVSNSSCTAYTPVVESVMEGFNGAVLAYGQTGTGEESLAAVLPIKRNRSTYQAKPFYLSSETVLPIE